MNTPTRIAVWIGGLALLAATAIDTLAAIGRQVGLPLTGSIELMQAAVIVSGSFGLLLATLARSHARVLLLVDRLSPARRLWADRFSDLLTLLFFLALLAGSAWLSIELWNSHEQSEWLGVPWRWLRIVANLCLLAASIYLAGRIFCRRAA